MHWIERLNCSLMMVTSSKENIFRVTGPLCGEFTDRRLILLTKASDALMNSPIWAWTNGWVNNRGAGDLIGHRAHFDITLMYVFTRCLIPWYNSIKGFLFVNRTSEATPSSLTACVQKTMSHCMLSQCMQLIACTEAVTQVTPANCLQLLLVRTIPS